MKKIRNAGTEYDYPYYGNHYWSDMPDRASYPQGAAAPSELQESIMKAIETIVKRIFCQDRG